MKITEIYNADTGTADPAIEIEKTPEFLEHAKEFSDFIRNLPLSTDDNDKLVHGMTEQVNEASRMGFLQGVKLGRDIARLEMKGVNS